MLITSSFEDQPTSQLTWEEHWEGRDQGLICSWARGIEKARELPELAESARRGELPSLPWVGGGNAIKAAKRTGSLRYLAMWQGLRHEDLRIDTTVGATLTCSATSMVVTFTEDAAILWKAAARGAS